MKPDDSTDEKKLQQELEFLYQKVAGKDRPEGDIPEGEDLSVSYRALEVAPDASLAEIADAYERLCAAWREDRFPGVPAWEEKSKGKREEIKEAYEKILLLRWNESRGTAQGILRTEMQADATTPLGSDTVVSPVPPARSRLQPYLYAAIAVTCFGLGAALFYRPGGEKPVLSVGTANALRDTVPAPVTVLPAEKPRTSAPATQSDGPVAISRNAAPVLPSGKNQQVPASTAPAGKITASRSDTALPAGKTEQPKPAPTRADTQIPSAAPSPAKEKAEPAVRQKRPATHPSVADDGSSGRTFSIQLKSFSKRSEAEAFVRTIKGGGMAVRIEEASLANGTQWFRVLMGRFPVRNDATAYLLAKRMKETYPGCFVQSAQTEQ